MLVELGVGEGRGEGVGTTDRFTRLSGGKAYQGSFEPAKGEASPLGTPGRRGERGAILLWLVYVRGRKEKRMATKKRGRVVSVRVSEGVYERLVSEADRRGVAPGAVLRSYFADASVAAPKAAPVRLAVRMALSVASRIEDELEQIVRSLHELKAMEGLTTLKPAFLELERLSAALGELLRHVD